MPKRNDGNEQDLRVRPALDAPTLSDNPYDGDACATHGSQTDLNVSAETPDGTLTYNWKDITDTCPAGFSPGEVSKLFIRILKNHFSRPENFIDQRLSQYVYSDNAALSKIRITLNTTFDTKQHETLPTLVVKRGEQKMQRVAMDDFGESGQPMLGLPHFIRFVQGSHRVLCLGATDGFTELLALEVFTLLNCLSPYIRKDLPMHDFQVAGMSEMGVLEELGSTLGVAVESSYTYEYGWTSHEVAPTLHAALARLDVSLERASLE